VCQQLRIYPAVQHFIKTYPGTGAFQPPVTIGFLLWLRILHFLNALLMLFIIRAGLQVLADHPRLAVDAGCEPGREWLRLRGPVPPDRMKQEPPERAWSAKGRCAHPARLARPTGDTALDRPGPPVVLQL
jgi:methionine sulfoxide reductase catalytic subunit